MSDQWRRVNELFDAALSQPPDQRVAFVAARAGHDSAVRDEVLSLLDAHDRAGRFLESPARGPGDAPSASPETPDRPIGSYLIERELGRGGMGIVYLAEDQRLGRKVALKALAPEWTRDPKRRERLRAEARAAARLSHPNIGTVYALEEIDGELFISSEYLPGRTLRQELEAGVMPLDRVFDIGAQVARGLAAAHAAGIVHRDLKPENVAVGEQGGVKILDFGIARAAAPDAAQGSSRLTEPGAIIGTPGYMSPEQIDAEEVDFRSDLFSFGVVLYELATGVHPFEGRTPASTIGRILAFDPRPPSQWRALPAEFDRIVRRCLQKRRDDRYQSTSDLALDLEQLGAGAPARAAVAGAAEGPAMDADSRAGVLAHERQSAGTTRDRQPSPGERWWRVHQVSLVGVYATVCVIAGIANEWVARDWSNALFFGCVAAAALNGTLRVHLLFTERHNPAAFKGELRRARPWLRGSDLIIGLVLLGLAVPVAAIHISVAIALAAVGSGAIVASIAVEPATTDAAFPHLET